MKICKIVKMAKNHFQSGHWDLEDYRLTFFSPYRLIIDFLIQNVVQLKIRFSEQIDTPDSSFWSEGPKNPRNLKILDSKFVPRGFEAQQTWGLKGQQHGVSRGSSGVSRRSNMGS